MLTIENARRFSCIPSCGSIWNYPVTTIRQSMSDTTKTDNESSAESFQARFARLMKESKISQTDLAVQAGVTASAISQYKTGGVENIDYRIFLRMAKSLNVSPWYLAFGVEIAEAQTERDNIAKGKIVEMCEDVNKNLGAAVLMSVLKRLDSSEKEFLLAYAEATELAKDIALTVLKKQKSDAKTEFLDALKRLI